MEIREMARRKATEAAAGAAPVKVRKSRKETTPRSRGPFGLSVAEAGAMIGLSINPAYAAAKAGEIPTVKVGGLLIVPRLVWLKMLGVEKADEAAA
jgi:hypothetical protein